MERHQIEGNEEIRRVCELAARLYNKANYLFRQLFFSKQRLPNMSILWDYVKNESCAIDFGNTKTAKQVLWKLCADWSNYFKSIKAWDRDHSKFKSRPKFPGYKDKMAQVIFYNETVAKKPLKSGIITPTNHLFSIKSEHCQDFKQVIVTPKTFGFIVEVSYEVKTEPPKRKTPKQVAETKSAFIDMGVNNLAAVTSDQPGLSPLLVNGRIVKSINQWFNKKPGKKASAKRYWRLENYFHHVSKLIVQWCEAHGLTRIVIGRNQGWKQGARMRKPQSQNFQSIPFSDLQSKIEYKAKMAGIDVVYTEEAWTSQASFFDNDPIPEYVKGQPKPQMSGVRNRGVYTASDGFQLNSDVNGSLNIGRKIIGQGPDHQVIEGSHLARVDRSVAATLVAVNPLKAFSHLEVIKKAGLADSNHRFQ